VATRGNVLKVVVNVSVAVFSVLNINDAQQTMTSSVSINLRWHDKALSWNTSDYDGVEMVEIPVDSVWTPHVYISNSLDKKTWLQTCPLWPSLTTALLQLFWSAWWKQCVI